MIKSLKNNSPVATILFVLFFVTLPLKNNINSITLILLTSFSLANIQSFSLLKFKRFYPFIVLYCVVTVSLIYTENLSRGSVYLEKYIVFLLIPFIFSTIDFNKNTLKKCLLYFTIMIVLLSLYCEVSALYGLIENNDSFSSLLNKKYSYLNFSAPVDLHPAYFSLFIITSILSVYWFMLIQYKKNIKALCLMVILFLSLVIVQLANRTHLITLFIVFNWIFFHYLLRTFKNKLITLSVLLVTNALLILVVSNTGYTQKRIRQVFGYTYANGYKHEDGKNKLKQWSAAINSNENIFFGNGMGDANQTIFQEYKSANLIYFLMRKYNAHNQYIQLYVGLGIFGVLLILYIMFKGGYLAYRLDPSIFFALFLIVPIAFLTESYLERHHGYMFFTLAYCLVFLFSQTRSGPPLSVNLEIK